VETIMECMTDKATMDRLIEEHIAAESRGDSAGSVAMYTDDVVHDVVGFPKGPAHGKGEAQEFYKHLIENIKTQKMAPVRSYYGPDFCVVEHLWEGTVPGVFQGIPGNGRRISFRMLHVWEFRDGKISRENVWIDGASIVAQLTAKS
jgi:steroid delta-isomerase-like uncharacterized protein